MSSMGTRQIGASTNSGLRRVEVAVTIHRFLGGVAPKEK